MEIPRNRYLDKLVRRKHNGLVKIVTGIRRCGKSYLLNTLFRRHLLDSGVDEKHVVRFAFDSAPDLMLIGEDLAELQRRRRKVDPAKFVSFVQSRIADGDMHYLLLDEVQMLDSFESVLNGCLRMENVDVYVTGSNAKFLSRDIVTEFAGRGDEIRMRPLSFAEYMEAFGGDRYEGLTRYMLYGGIPMVALLEDDADKAAMLDRLFDEIYLRDMEQRHRLRDTAEMDEILDMLASSIGSPTNPEKLRRTFHSARKSNISGETVKKYLDVLEDSFLVESARRYDIKGKAYVASPRKYYFADLGLRNARLNFRQFEENHCMENVVYNELKARGMNVDIGSIDVLERNSAGKVVRKRLEVDFVCNQGTKRIYVQSAFSMPDAAKAEQETRPFRRIGDSFRKIVVTHDAVPPHYDDDGMLTVNIYDFLLDESILAN